MIETKDEFDDLQIVSKAITAAKKAYYDTLEQEGIDGAYYPLYNLIVCFMDSDLTTVMRIIEDSDLSTNGGRLI